MPYSKYLPEHMGSIKLLPPGPFVAGSYAELVLVYTAGTFGIDDTGMVKVSWRTTSDMSKPQFNKPDGPNFTTVEASNSAKLEVWFDRLNVRPLCEHIAHSRRSRLSPSRRYIDDKAWRSEERLARPAPANQCREQSQLRTSVDAFATYEFCELPEQPAFDLVAGPAVRWKAVLPSLAVVGELFRLAIVAEDMWGNPTEDAAGTLKLEFRRSRCGAYRAA